MDVSVPRRVALFASEPVPELRGLAALTDPDDDVAAVIDLALMGARGDGKTQFLVHAIRALHARAPALAGGEAEHNRAVMRLVLDPRAPRPDATPPGVVPHFTFRARASVLFEQLGWRGAFSLARRLARVGGLVALACGLGAAAVGCALVHRVPLAAIAAAGAALIAASAVLVARTRIARAGEIEIAFWDVAGEHVYGEGAADYHALLGRLVDARRRRAAAVGRAYAFAPVLICNPLALGTFEEGSPYARMRAVLPLFAALDREASRALIAVNRWAVVDPICERGALREEVVTVTARARGEGAMPAYRVARERVRVCCLDAEDGRDGHVAIDHVRYDTAIASRVEPGGGDGDGDPTLIYEYDDGPGAFGGDARRRFLAWLVRLPHWTAVRAAAPRVEPERDARGEPIAHEVWARPR
ncbi:MAG TPA: hypothetical protein VGF94_05015 [Kofleriaceae bacterium]|jgi:hypothetical protein